MSLVIEFCCSWTCWSLRIHRSPTPNGNCSTRWHWQYSRTLTGWLSTVIHWGTGWSTSMVLIRWGHRRQGFPRYLSLLSITGTLWTSTVVLNTKLNYCNVDCCLRIIDKYSADTHTHSLILSFSLSLSLYWWHLFDFDVHTFTSWNDAMPPWWLIGVVL